MGTHIGTFIGKTAATLALWQGTCWFFSLAEYLLPSPLMVARAFNGHANTLAVHGFYTSIECTTGLLCAVVLALLSGLLFSYWPKFDAIVRPLLVIMQTIPSFIFMPFFVLWLGFGWFPKMVIVTLTGFFPITLAMLDGLKRTPKAYLELEHLFETTAHRSFWIIRLPSALPAFFTGIRWACLQTSVAVIAADWLGSSQGLGYLILNSYSRMNISVLFCCVILLVVYARFLMYAVRVIEHRLVFW